MEVDTFSIDWQKITQQNNSNVIDEDLRAKELIIRKYIKITQKSY